MRSFSFGFTKDATSSDVPVNGEVEVDVRGKRLKAVIPSKHISNNVPPYAVPVIYKQK